MLSFTLINALIIFFVMFSCAFIGATTGGSAIIAIPACMFLGFDPQVAVATTRFGVVGSCVTGLYGFKNKGKVDRRIGILSSLFSTLGAIIGACIMVSLSGEVLKRFIGAMMAVVVLISFLKKMGWIRPYEEAPALLRQVVGYCFFFLIGVLGGSVGGQGILAGSTLILIFGQTFLEAAGTRLISALAIAISSLFIYQAGGIIHWPFALVILAGMSIGGYLGMVYGIKKGEEWIEKLFHMTVLVLAAKLLLF